MSSLLDSLRGLGVGRLIALGAVAFAMMSFLTVLTLRGSNEHLALLYGDLDLRESSQIADLLTRQKLPYQLGGGGSQILVATDQVPQARLLLAKEGLPTGGSIGYEIFDRGDSLTASQFQQNVNQARALEGELSRTIRGIRGVKSARVHLVLPKREPFARDRQDAQASVQLGMVGITKLDNEGTRAILNLVAAAVPGLRPQNIAITDTRGNLLARAGEPVGPSAAAQGNDEQRRTGEVRIARAIEEMLERSVGTGRVRAEASIEFDYEQIRETQERYDPDQQVVRSSQTVTNNSKTSEQSATVSVQNNLPNADAGSSPSGTQEQRSEETTNYEIAKTVRTVVRDQPKIVRLSLAVMVDGVTTRGLDGTPLWKERPPEELDRIARLVRSAVGFDEKRGDKIEIVSLQFQSDPDGDTPVREVLPFGLEKTDLLRLLQTAVFGLLAIVAIMLVLRPMVARLTLAATVPALSQGTGSGSDVLLESSLDDSHYDSSIGINKIPSVPKLTGPAQARRPSIAVGSSEDESMVNLANVEGQLKASSIRRIADLIEKHPDESLSIVRAWMQQEAT